VAREIGVTPQRMSQITREQKAISLRTMCRLANVFEVPLSDLLFEEVE
jgi:transcriptional regulator with XRE-family HTH domain